MPGDECFSSFYFLSVFQVFYKVYFLQKYKKYAYRQKKCYFFKERSSILNDFETCHSVDRLRPAAFLPSYFVPVY